MIIGPRRAILIGAIAAVVLTIILIPLIFETTSPDFSKVKVLLSGVSVQDADDKSIQLRPAFTIQNPTDQAITTSHIEFELFADGTSLGNHTISYEDVPLNGRPAIFSGGSASIPTLQGHPFVVENSTSITSLYSKIRDNPESVQWSAKGQAAIESTLVQTTIDFENSL